MPFGGLLDAHSRYLDEHPQYKDEGVSMSKFSFQIPKPLQENYVRKRPSRAELTNEAGDHGMPGYLPSPEGDIISLRFYYIFQSTN